MAINKSKVAVVILNWNGKSFLEKFLPGVISTCNGIAEVIISDNASTDGSVEYVNKVHPGLRVIRLEKNEGYTGGYNAALKQVDAEYYVLLNSDVETVDDWISPVIKLMDSNQKIAACQPKILSWHHKGEFEYAGAGGGFIDHFGYPFCRGRIFQSLEQDHGQYNDNHRIFWATGACMFVRASCFHEFNGLDLHFFAHMEEIDLCWRMQRGGYEIWYCGESEVYHVGGGTLPKNNPRKTYFNFRNNLFLLYKNLPSGEFKKVYRRRQFFDFLAAVKFLFSNGWADCSAVLRAHRDFKKDRHMYSRPENFNYSPDFQKHRLIYPKSILFAHYFRGIKKFSDLKGR